MPPQTINGTTKHIIKMKKIRAAVVGYGNIGKYALEALEAAPDFEVAGIVRRNGAENKPAELAQYEVVKDIKELKDVDVAILATPTRSCEEYAKQILPLGINTVDSFDIHGLIRDYRRTLTDINKKTNTVSVIAAGWDPGSDSIVRTLMQSLAPKGLSYTNFGPGMSMGHSVCVRSKAGVKNALTLKGWCEECSVNDYPLGRRHPPPYGICRVGRGC